MRVQLRPFYTPEELTRVYASVYDHTRWPDHIMRVRYTIHLANWLANQMNAKSATDLSCGDGSILKGINIPGIRKVFGDFVTNNGYQYSGPIENSVTQIDLTDIFILSETIEHVEDPDTLLHSIRQKSRSLLLTTPLGEVDNGNPEHYWGWNQDDMEEMLHAAGWKSVIKSSFDPGYGYIFQMWGCV